MALEKVFTKKEWHDDAPPYIDEVEMNARDDAMDQMDDRIISLDQRLTDVEENGVSAEYQYSQDPQIVGWWTDGRPIYEKLFVVEGQKNESFDIPSEDTNYKYFLSASGNAFSVAKNKKVNLPYNGENQSVNISANDYEKSVTVEVDSTGYKNFYISVRYGGKIILKSFAPWSTGTDAEISLMLQAHYDDEIDIHDYWNIGDTRVVHLSAMDAVHCPESHAAQDVELVLASSNRYNSVETGKPCAFVVVQKEVLKNTATGAVETGYLASNDAYYYPYRNYERRTWCDSIYYNSLPDSIKHIFKKFSYPCRKEGYSSGLETLQNYFTLPSGTEMVGNDFHQNNEGTQFEYYRDLGYTGYGTPITVSRWTRTLGGESANYYLMPTYYDKVNGRYRSWSQENRKSGRHGIAPMGCI